MSLAGIHFPDTTAFFGDERVLDATRLLAERGWYAEGQAVWMADHFKAAGDLVANAVMLLALAISPSSAAEKVMHAVVERHAWLLHRDGCRKVVTDRHIDAIVNPVKAHLRAPR